MKLLFENWRKLLNEESDSSNQDNETDLLLPQNKKIVLKADTPDHDRGLVVKWREDGGYDVYYWYDDPDTPVPAELEADGKKIGDDIKKVFLGFHPELDDK
tara:strand:+ start:813 stop:1115 length:303 start_codon:yes stop_codon:yes gene_type:complete